MVIRNSKPGKGGINKFLDRVHMLLDRAIEGLSPEEMNWRPSPSSNTIGNLLKHITGSEAFWIHHVAGGLETNRVRALEFEIREFPIDEVLEEYSRVKEVSRTVIGKLTEEDLEESHIYVSAHSPNRGEQQATVHWCLMHAIEHSSQHIGQIFYIRKMYADRMKG
jgi:uncharacterized damage-inducible protein DinB